MVALVGIAGLLGACSGGVSRTVDSPPIDIRTALAANESSLTFVDQLVGAGHSAEATDKGIVWHFFVNGQDYARYVITIADKPGGSKVVGVIRGSRRARTIRRCPFSATRRGR